MLVTKIPPFPTAQVPILAVTRMRTTRHATTVSSVTYQSYDENDARAANVRDVQDGATVQSEGEAKDPDA